MCEFEISFLSHRPSLAVAPRLLTKLISQKLGAILPLEKYTKQVPSFHRRCMFVCVCVFCASYL